MDGIIKIIILILRRSVKKNKLPIKSADSLFTFRPDLKSEGASSQDDIFLSESPDDDDFDESEEKGKTDITIYELGLL